MVYKKAHLGREMGEGVEGWRGIGGERVGGSGGVQGAGVRGKGGFSTSTRGR